MENSIEFTMKNNSRMVYSLSFLLFFDCCIVLQKLGRKQAIYNFSCGSKLCSQDTRTYFLSLDNVVSTVKRLSREKKKIKKEYPPRLVLWPCMITTNISLLTDFLELFEHKISAYTPENENRQRLCTALKSFVRPRKELHVRRAPHSTAYTARETEAYTYGL